MFQQRMNNNKKKLFNYHLKSLFFQLELILAIRLSFSSSMECIGFKPLYRYGFAICQFNWKLSSIVCVHSLHMLSRKEIVKLCIVWSSQFGEIDIQNGWNSLRISTDSNEYHYFQFRKFHRLIEFFFCIELNPLVHYLYIIFVHMLTFNLWNTYD